MNAIEVENLTKRFGNLTAVDRISFDVKKGEFHGHRCSFMPIGIFGSVAGGTLGASYQRGTKRKSWLVVF